MKPLDLIKTAKRLSRTPGSRRPRDSALRRAVRTAYYAMFHALCETCADCMIGTASADRSAPAWSQAYRAVEHGFAKAQCQNKKVMAKFPKQIEDFANLFVDLQIARHAADYDPFTRFVASDIDPMLAQADIAIRERRGRASRTAGPLRPGPQ